MSKTVYVKIEGLSELQSKLEGLPKKIADKIFRHTLKAAGEIVRKAMSLRAPKDTGFLEQHIDTKVKIKRADIAGSAFVGPEGKMDYPLRSGGYEDRKSKKTGKIRQVGRIAVARVARWLEFGTKTRSAHPFMTSAWESTKQQALDKIVGDLKEVLEKEGN